MASFSHLLSLISLISLLPFSYSSNNTTITLSLTPLLIPTNPLYKNTSLLNHLTASSLARAKQLKTPQLTKTPLFPRSYGGYSVSLSFGTPPQVLDFVMDTGSSLVWFPCTHLYLCSQCDFPNIDPGNITTFLPKSSSSAKVLGCKDPKCGLLFGPNVQTRCQGCDGTSVNCPQNCPDYVVEYGSGTTAGLLLSDTLVFSNSSVDEFVVGCSIFSDSQPCGIAGFGRGPASLPAQMGLKKFSYCLVSHRFDDKPETSELVLFRGYTGDGFGGGVRYTPFINPTNTNPAYQDYYYVSLRKITVGGVHVKVPFKFLEPAADGNGGTIVDSGTTFTYLDHEVYELVAQEFEKQMGNYSRAKDVETRAGLRPCYNITGNMRMVVPDLFFHFKGGVKVEFPLADYFSIIGDESNVVCMTMVTSSVNVNDIGGAGGATEGPSIIIGNYQQQNFYVEYDLEKKRIGFRKQICK
ncbi:putative aspartyl protease At4g16563 [Apium graveolens]|uniref:putative aspartyl protease At4g16563 n=1 Tax=Apium graveolens TaxID=4045 RepID=UPI003D7A0B3D